jgi:hypothetical protein
MCSVSDPVSRDSGTVRPRPSVPFPSPAPPRPRKPLAAAAVAFHWISKPILPATPDGPFWSGLLVIGTGPAAKCYMVSAILGANGDDLPGMLGWRLTLRDGETRDVDALTWSCDCPDATFRSDRPGPNGHGSNCKHVVNLRAALQAIGLEAGQGDGDDQPGPPCDPATDPFVTCELFADDPRWDWRYEVTPEDLPMID